MSFQTPRTANAAPMMTTYVQSQLKLDMKVSMSGDLVESVGAGGGLPEGQPDVVVTRDGQGQVGLLALLLRPVLGEHLGPVVDAPRRRDDEEPHHQDEGQYVHLVSPSRILDMAMPTVTPTSAMTNPVATPTAKAIIGSAPSGRRRTPTRCPRRPRRRRSRPGPPARAGASRSRSGCARTSCRGRPRGGWRTSTSGRR